MFLSRYNATVDSACFGAYDLRTVAPEVTFCYAELTSSETVEHCRHRAEDNRNKRVVLESAVTEVQDQADDISSFFGEDFNLLTNLLANTDAAKQGIMETILEYNKVEVEEGLFWTNAYLHNAKHGAEGEHVGFGILGITIPTVLWEDLQLMDSGTSKSIDDAVDSMEEAVDEVIDDILDDDFDDEFLDDEFLDDEFLDDDY